MKQVFKKIKSFFVENKERISGISIATIGIIILICGISYILSFADTKNERYSPLKVETCVYTLKYDAAKLEIINEVDKYIKSVAPQSSLDAYVVVEECLNNSLDICFVLAQGEQESHFGTTGLARRTNSVFNVYAFDGHSHEQISEKGKYKHPNYSVAPLYRIIKKRLSCWWENRV